MDDDQTYAYLYDILYGTKKPILTEKVKKRMLDRDVPWDKMPPAHAKLYASTEKAEWDDWLARGSVRICTLRESRPIEQKFDKSHIIGLRFVYRDKNASTRTPQSPLPVKAKARVSAKGWYDQG